MQQRFVDCYLTGDQTMGKPAKAAIAAGYAPKNADQLAHQLLQKPHVLVAIDKALRDAIGTRLTVKAVAVIENIIENPEASLKLRGDMAAKVIEFSGLIERTKAAKAKETGFDKPIAEMTRAELEAVVARGVDVLKMADELAQQSARPN
jgi:phage terminase small subunit